MIIPPAAGGPRRPAGVPKSSGGWAAAGPNVSPPAAGGARCPAGVPWCLAVPRGVPSSEIDSEIDTEIDLVPRGVPWCPVE
eukprot:6983099-Pyramimonas_sp.AAC.1